MSNPIVNSLIKITLMLTNGVNFLDLYLTRSVYSDESLFFGGSPNHLPPSEAHGLTYQPSQVEEKSFYSLIRPAWYTLWQSIFRIGLMADLRQEHSIR